MIKNKLSSIVLALGLICLVSGGFMMQNAMANQPHMYSALDSLRAARNQLNQAERDKGGHRTKAVNLINSAIEQVQLGIDAGA